MAFSQSKLSGTFFDGNMPSSEGSALETLTSERTPIGHDDLLQIDDLSIDSVLENLRIRYDSGICYTYIGEVCVSVNPNRNDMSHIYDRDHMAAYFAARQNERPPPPHIFSIAASAYRQTFDNGLDSCVIITGESGSGKTEACKLLHRFIAHSVKTAMKQQQTYCNDNDKLFRNVENVENILLHSNCIFEAFGNATTLRNANSSRFAKYTEIYCEPLPTRRFGAVIHNYLLEKSRVVATNRAGGERNFHVFYQLLASKLDDDEKDYDNLRLVGDPFAYRYLANSSIASGDRAAYRAILESMQIIGIDDADRASIFRLLAGILHLGNVDFVDHEDGDESNALISSESVASLLNFCRLLSLDFDRTRETLLSRSICVRGDIARKPYRSIDAQRGRDALAKSLYERLFYFILRQINRSLLQAAATSSCSAKNETIVCENRFTQPPIPQIGNSIGILDIYGFEVALPATGESPLPPPNRFEQFLVNYCNEKLHQVFVDAQLIRTQKLYRREDIAWRPIEFANNSAICAMIDSPRRGMFSAIDESCISCLDYRDGAVLQEFNRRFANDSHYASRQTDPGSTPHIDPVHDFVVRHYAGDVRYTIDGFVRGNMDLLYIDYKRLLRTSANPIIKDMWQDGELQSKSESEKIGRTIPNKLPETTAAEFRRSMSELIERLRGKYQLFVRCIKPSDDLMISSEILPLGYDENINRKEVADYGGSGINQCAARFSDAKVRHQIQYLGLVENARIAKAGFVRRHSYANFARRYRMLISNADDNDMIVDDNNINRLIMTSKPAIEKKDANEIDDVDDLRSSADAKLCARIVARFVYDDEDCKVKNENENEVDQRQEKQESKIIFGKTMIFIRHYRTIESLERARFRFLERIVIELQTYSRSLLAKRQSQRLELAQQIFRQYVATKKCARIRDLFYDIERYEAKLKAAIAANDSLEYYHIPAVRRSDRENAFPAIIGDGDFRVNKLQSELTIVNHTLNRWLTILRFSPEYWNDKLLRIEAEKIFTKVGLSKKAHRKIEWGQSSRRRWIGNYLTGSDCDPASSSSNAHFSIQQKEFRQFFRKNLPIFAAYVLKTNANNLECVRALVMTARDINKIDIDSMQIGRTISIANIDSVSLTPDADQLVVIHTRGRDDVDRHDLVFTFFDPFLPPDRRSKHRRREQLRINTAHNSLEIRSDADSKVGEFVTLLALRYRALTKSMLKINFCRRINFKFDNRPMSVEVIARGDGKSRRQQSKKSLEPTCHYSIRRLFTLKSIRDLYFRLSPFVENDADPRRSRHLAQRLLLEKRSKFKMIGSDAFVLVNNVD